MMELLLPDFRRSRGNGVGIILTRSARMGETSMNEIQSIKQYSKLTLIELSGMNEVD